MYRPLFRPQQPDPTTYLDWYNCTMSSGAMALDFHTQGKVQKWGGELRKLSGDASGGTSITDLMNAWNRLGYTLTDRRGKTWNDLIADLKNGKGVVLQGDYDVLIGDDTCQGTFEGDHAIYLNPEFININGSILVGDPLCQKYKWITVPVLKRYAEKLGIRVYGPPMRKPGVPYPGQSILYATTRAWPILPPVVPPKENSMKFNPLRGGDGVVTYTKDSYMINVETSAHVPVKAGYIRNSLCKVTYGATNSPGFLVTLGGPAHIAPAVVVTFKATPIPTAADLAKAQADLATANSRITTIKGKVAANNADVQND